LKLKVFAELATGIAEEEKKRNADAALTAENAVKQNNTIFSQI
jgi:hypothetical protein